MEGYRVVLHDGREMFVEGDSIELVREKREDADCGDIVIRNAEHITAHFKGGEVDGYERRD